MKAEILLDRKKEDPEPEGDQGPFKTLEERIGDLLREFQNLKKERDNLTHALGVEKERLIRMEKRLEVLSQEREKIKIRIDQLLYRLKGVEG